jgi:hypothetical protein
MTGDYFEVCHVTDVCFDGQLYFFHPSVPKPEGITRRSQVDWAHLDSTLNPVSDAREDERREKQRGYPVFRFPFGSIYKGRLVGSDYLNKVRAR